MNMISFCAICLADDGPSDQQVCVTSCGHFFHHSCLQKWLSSSATCPECRAVVTRENVVRRIHPHFNQQFAKKLEMMEQRTLQLETENWFLKEENASLKAVVGSTSKLIVQHFDLK